mmetsp:Transcript_60234/g.111677  ORF Transcript_60234/g.111677 Transcript_60234/m.111677 type:complete len:282 (-) Transcript_60234:52-897(-)
MAAADADTQAKLAERSLLWRDVPPDEFGPTLEDKKARAHQAVLKQCSNARVPGYCGFLPSAHAEDIYGCTQAAALQVAAEEQTRRRAQREEQEERQRQRARRGIPQPAAGKPLDVVIPDDHPLGKSRSNIVRSHWVPTIPGYCGHIPGKEAENIIGGGITATCRLAGRAIAERERTTLSFEDNPEQNRIKEIRFAPGHSGDGTDAEEVERFATSIQQRKINKIPGYQGHIPRLQGDSIFGANFSAVNQISADLCEDRLRNPHDHFSRVCMPQFPPPKQLRG